MWFAAGGWGMYPVSLFGFLLVIASLLYAMRPQAKYEKPVLALGVITWAAGVLGTATGIVATSHYIQNVDKAKQFEIFCLGLDESLHDLILALMIIVPATLIALVGMVRAAWSAPRAA